MSRDKTACNKMAECKDEKFTTEISNDHLESKSNESEQVCTEAVDINKESTDIGNDRGNGEKSQENGVQSFTERGTELPQTTSTQNDCISSEENSPIKTGFLRSFMEKKQLISPSSGCSENGQFKTE